MIDLISQLIPLLTNIVAFLNLAYSSSASMILIEDLLQEISDYLLHNLTTSFFLTQILLYLTIILEKIYLV